MSTEETVVRTDAAPEGGADGVPEVKEVPSWRLILTLAVAGALSALLLSVVYEATLPAIKANRARVLREAVGEVLPGTETIRSFAVKPEGLVAEEKPVFEVDVKSQNRVFLGLDADGKPLGFALVGAAYGYGSDPIMIAFGYDPKTKEVIGLKVLGHKETPGLGTKIETEGWWTRQFWRSKLETAGEAARQYELVPVRPGEGDAADPHQVDTISGATISTKAVIVIINDVVGTVGPKLDVWQPEGE